jgi:O-succinylbenzoic acid--CoA ligase
MYTGGAIEMLPGFDETSFAAALHGAVTMVSVVPTMLTRIIEHRPFTDLRAVLVGGGPIPDGLLERAAAAGLPVLPTYGMTETFGQVATLKPGAPVDYKGHPLPGVKIRLEPDRRIAVRGDQVSPGYLGEPDRPDPWLITNDLGTIDDDGAVRVLGRADTVIVTGGENVSPERVEAVLREHPAIDDLVVVGVPDGEWGEAIVCLYQGRPADIGEWARARLPGFMVPKRFVLVDSVPTTPMGKPDRSKARVLAE